MLLRPQGGSLDPNRGTVLPQVLQPGYAKMSFPKTPSGELLTALVYVWITEREREMLQPLADVHTHGDRGKMLRKLALRQMDPVAAADEDRLEGIA
jgi:hypothetical protein